jgi:hypothetical protein
MQRAASHGGTTRIEDLKAPVGITKRNVRVAEHDGVGVRKAPAKTTNTTSLGSCVVYHADPDTI